jgi:hypothetical protein
MCRVGAWCVKRSSKLTGVNTPLVALDTAGPTWQPLSWRPRWLMVSSGAHLYRFINFEDQV